MVFRREYFPPFFVYSDKFKIVGSHVRSTFEDGNNSTITKAFVWSIFIEVEPTFLLVIEKVEVLLGKYLFDLFLVFANSKGGRAVDAEAMGIDF